MGLLGSLVTLKSLWSRGLCMLCCLINTLCSGGSAHPSPVALGFQDWHHLELTITVSRKCNKFSPGRLAA